MRITKIFLAATFFIFSNLIVKADSIDQEQKIPWYKKGQVYGKIFANFHTSGTDVGKENAFELKRAYLGYSMDLDKHFATNIKLDIGNPDDFSSDSAPDLVLGRRFAFFKNAYMQYKIQNLKIKFGIADAYQFKVQEKFWGYRYISQSFQDKNKFGSSADIGLFASYKFTDWISADYSLVNGEGYGKIQTDDNLKNTLGVTIHPIKPITFRAYGDIYSISDSSQISSALFLGAKFDKFRVGVEYNIQIRNKFKEDHNMSGYSIYGTFNILDNLNIFGRYDHLTSNVIDATLDTDPWNYEKDGDFIIGGVEFSPKEKINLSLNYQQKLPDGGDDVSSIYFNLQVSF